jgi:hypothetical protein
LLSDHEATKKKRETTKSGGHRSAIIFIIAAEAKSPAIDLPSSTDHPLTMSMLQKLKESNTDSIFMEDEDMDVDNMDFPLPDAPSSSGANGLEEMFAKLSAGQTQRPAAASPSDRNIAVVNTPQGIQRLDPSVYKT